MNRSPRSGFTLFELLILLALFVVLFALMLPAVAKVRMAAARTQSQNNLKQIGLAIHNYYDTNGKMPSGVDAKGFSASAYLLPYIEQQNVYNLIDFKKPFDDKANAPARADRTQGLPQPQRSDHVGEHGLWGDQLPVLCGLPGSPGEKRRRPLPGVGSEVPRDPGRDQQYADGR